MSTVDITTALPEDSVLLTVEQKYRAAVDYLNDTSAYMLAHVLNLGYPVLDSMANTAFVALEAHQGTSRVVFHINPEFVKPLTAAQLATVLAHETMHYKLNHPKMSLDFGDASRFNIAADLVINDYLVSYLGLQTVPGILHGLDVVGTDCSWLTVSQVYDMLPDALSDPECGLSSSGDGSAEGAGLPSLSDDAADGSSEADLGEFLDSLPVLGEGWDIPAPLLDSSDGSAGCSTAPSLSEEKTVEVDSSLSLNWVSLLQEVDPTMFKGNKGRGKVNATFSHRPRRLASAPTNVALPEYSPATKGRTARTSTPLIVLALDTSGSISARTVRKFLTLAKSIPQAKAIVEVCTFTTVHKKLDIDNPKYQSGGTSFSAVKNFVDQVLKEHKKVKYPDRVIVITDGFAAFDRGRPSYTELASWRWLIEGSPRQLIVSVNTDTVFSLDTFVK